MNQCIVNVGFGGWHPKGSFRLRRSLIEHGFAGEIKCWTDELPPGSPTHQDVPYGMKVAAMEWAKEHGHQHVMWLDSSVWCVRHPEQHFAAIQREGYYMADSGWMVDQWTNDHCLAHFGVTREAAAMIPMISAGILGLGFDNPIASEFLRQWREAMEDGCFNGRWFDNEKAEGRGDRYRGHRHDQSCASLIAHRLGMVLHPKETLDMYYRPQIPDTVEFVLQGM